MNENFRFHSSFIHLSNSGEAVKFQTTSKPSVHVFIANEAYSFNLLSLELHAIGILFHPCPSCGMLIEEHINGYVHKDWWSANFVPPLQFAVLFLCPSQLDRSSPAIVLGASLNALGAYCMGMCSDFQTCADIVKNHQGSSEVCFSHLDLVRMKLLLSDSNLFYTP